MITQNLFFVQLFQSFSQKCRIFLLQSCPKKFIRILCKFMVILLRANLQSIQTLHVTKFQNGNPLLFLRRITWKQTKDVLSYKKRLQLINVITPPSSSNCLDMEKFVLVPASLSNNKKLNTETVTKKQLPMEQAEDIPTNQNDLLENEQTKTCLPKQTLKTTKFRLVLVSSFHFRRLYYWMVYKLEFYCGYLLKNFVVKTQTFHTFILLYVTLLVYLQLWI